MILKFFINFLILFSNNSASLKCGIIILSILLFLFPIKSFIELSNPWINGWILIEFLLCWNFLKLWNKGTLFLNFVDNGIAIIFFGFFNCFSIEESNFFFTVENSFWKLLLSTLFFELFEFIVS